MGYGGCSSGYVLAGESGAEYRFVKPLAMGGMSIVWLARSVEGEAVAVKLPRRDVSYAVSKLVFEIGLLRRLLHSNIVRFIDAGKACGVPALVEEYVEGPTLRQLVKSGGPLDEREVKARLIALLLAIDYLHSLNIIHRDIKPPNIVDNGGPRATKLIDMGTAAFYSTYGLKVVYSPGGYTAPEQMYGIAIPQNDIWSVMATGFYMVTGVDPGKYLPREYWRPRPGMPARLDPRIVRRDLDPRLAEAIARGLTLNTFSRIATAREALDLLLGRARPSGVFLEVAGVSIPVEAPIIVVGRLHDASDKDSTVLPGRPVGVKWFVEGDYMYVMVRDVYRLVSRRHAEIRLLQGRWYIRDLGSTHGTYVLTSRGIIQLHKGKGVPSNFFPLGRRSVILLGFDRSRGSFHLSLFFRQHAG